MVKQAFLGAFGQPETAINDKIRSYKPTEDDIYFTVPSGNYCNLIVAGDVLREREIEELAKFKAFLAENGLTVPSGWIDERNAVVRLLQHLHYDSQKVYDEIMRLDENYREHRVNLPNTLPDLLEDLNKGIVYAYGRDNAMRPIIIVNARRMLDHNTDTERLGQLIEMITNYLYFLGFVDGVVEGWSVIVDFKDVSLWELPLMKIAALVKFNTKTFRGVLVRCITVHTHSLIVASKRVVFSVLNEFTKMKTDLIGDDVADQLGPIFGLANLEEKYGGQLPNKESDFWPPQVAF